MKKYIKPAIRQVTIDNKTILAGSATGTGLNTDGFNKNDAALGKSANYNLWDFEEEDD